LTISGDLITCWWDGEAVLEVQDTRVVSGQYFGFMTSASNTIFLSLFEAYTAARQLMSAAPPTIFAGVAGQLVGLYGFGTQWTPGTPGDPEFTINAGSIVAQTIYTGTSAGITIDAPDEEQILVITDPNYGRVAHVRVTYSLAAPVNQSPDLTWLWNALVNRLAGIDIILAYLGQGTDRPYLYRIIDELGVTDPDTPSHGYIKDMVIDLAATLREVGTDSDDPDTLRHLVGHVLSAITDTLAELYALDGYPTRHTIQDVLDAIAALEPGGGNGDLEALTQLCTDILAELYIIDGYPTRHTIQDVLDAIAAIPPPDLGELPGDVDSILAIVDAMDGDGSTSLPGILGAISSMRGAGAHTLDDTYDRADAAAVSAAAADVAIGLVAAAVALLPGAIAALLTAQTVEINAALAAQTIEINAYTAAQASGINANVDLARLGIAGLEDHLDDLDSTLGLISLKVGQLLVDSHNYPGPLSCDFDTPVAIEQNMRIEAHMQGALVDITAAPARLGRWVSGDAVDYFHLGWATFETTDGYYDDYQQVKWNHGILVPKTISAPGALVLHFAPGVTGTVTPWRRSGS